MRVAQPAQEPAHPAEAELGRDPRHPQLFIVEPAVEIVETGLVIVEHRQPSGGHGGPPLRSPVGATPRGCPGLASLKGPGTLDQYRKRTKLPVAPGRAGKARAARDP